MAGYSPIMAKVFLGLDNDLLFYLTKKVLNIMEDKNVWANMVAHDNRGGSPYTSLECKFCGHDLPFADDRGGNHKKDCVYGELVELVAKLEGQNG